tara:strand:+ start:87 stop:485 length:399 start_codon:yes stop_codon:yes gene_type:complete
MTEEQIVKFKDFVATYGLTKDDFFKAPQGFVCVTRTGIEKIQRHMKLAVHYEVVPEFSDVSSGFYVIKAIAGFEDEENGILPILESYGEASPKNCRVGYPVAMAEKRALSRVVLKAADLYELGVYGEDEIGD